MPSGVQAARRAVVKVTGGAARPIAILAWFEELPRDLATLPATADAAKAN
jgi:hypothetical protein